MHAFLILGRDENTVNSKVREISDNLAQRSYKYSIGKIEMVRELNAFLRLTQSEKSAVIIRDVDDASTESLNAFLKNLEEPQKNISFILTAKNEFKLPDTILSRCQIVRTKNVIIGDENKDIESFFAASDGNKLKILSAIKKREEASDFLSSSISYLHNELISKNDNYSEIAKALEFLQHALDNIDANGNVTIHLANLAVKLLKKNLS